MQHTIFRYPSNFIDNEFDKFFVEYRSTSPFLPLTDDENQFVRMRHKLLGQPTPRQSQVAWSAATADVDNGQKTNDQYVQATTTTTITTTHKPEIHDKNLFIHYTHEKRFQSMKRDMHDVYDHVFRNTPAIDAKIIVGNRNRRNLNNELIRKRPKQTLLRNATRQSKTCITSQIQTSYVSKTYFFLTTSAF